MFDLQKLQWDSPLAHIIYEQGDVKIIFRMVVYHIAEGLRYDHFYTLIIGNDWIMEAEKLNEIQSYLEQLD